MSHLDNYITALNQRIKENSYTDDEIGKKLAKLRNKETFEYLLSRVKNGDIDKHGWVYNELANHYNTVIKDESIALVYYTEAASVNNVCALYNLSLFYENGKVVKKDENKAFELL